MTRRSADGDAHRASHPEHANKDGSIMDMGLLLLHADAQTPALAGGLPVAAAADAPRPAEKPLPEYLRADAEDPNALPLQRWGLVVPEGPHGDRLLSLIEPLRRAR